VSDHFEGESVSVRIVGKCLVFVHGANAPSNDEWDRAMELFVRIGPTRACFLVWTEGGAPNSAQRAKLAKLTGESKTPIAVLSDSSLVRAAGTAIRWFNPQIRIFPPTDIEGALVHLALDGAARTGARDAMTEMRTERARRPAAQTR